jgi:hypothetical protein
MPATHRILEPFTEQDEKLAKKLMKELMPNNYLVIKKRRNESSQILSATVDSTLRMPQGLSNRGFGIKKIDPKDLKDKTSAMNVKYRDPMLSHRGMSDFDHLQLISYCIGTAPQKYKMDIPHVNNQVMHIFSTDAKEVGKILSLDGSEDNKIH